MKVIKIKKCRLCNNRKLEKIHNFGNFYVSTFLENKNVKPIMAPLSLVYCKVCKLLQLEHSAPQEIMYKQYYWYKSGINKTMIKSLKELSSEIKKFIKLKANDIILDIGANDGTLLKNFKKNITIGCEPAKNLKKDLKSNSKYQINDFWNRENYNKLAKSKKLTKAKVITAIGMFYDLEDPNKFIKDAADCLEDDGIFVAQLMCLQDMLETNDMGNICHEHLEYYSYESLKYLFENNGFKIFKIFKNNVNGGSYRIYCKKNINKSFRIKEKSGIIEIKKFIKRVEDNRIKTINFINKIIKDNKKIFVYGASTKGNTILQYYKLTSKHIKYAADRNPVKWGKYTVGSKIKIISEETARKLKPDYFFILPWGFIKEFKKREISWLKKGGVFIVPFPKLKIIKE